MSYGPSSDLKRLFFGLFLVYKTWFLNEILLLGALRKNSCSDFEVYWVKGFSVKYKLKLNKQALKDRKSILYLIENWHIFNDTNSIIVLIIGQ